MLEKKGIKNKMIYFDYWEEYYEYIIQNINMAVLRKAHFYSTDTCRLMKNESWKKDQGEKQIQTFNFF